VVLDPSYYTDKYDYDNADTFLGRGINMGNYLEAPGSEGAWTGGRTIQQADFTLIAAAGYKTVRIPVRWSDHAATGSPYAITPAFLARVKQVVDWALGAGLKVVLNTHHYNEMFADPVTALPGHEARLHAIWSQLCDGFDTTAYPADRLVFELLNEPNGAVGYEEWNGIIADLTTLIWTTKGQAARRIMIGTANWGGPAGLERLRLPAACDAGNTIITVHWYEPMQFTHQGADWVVGAQDWIGTPWLGTEADQAPLLALLDAVTAWNSEAGRGFEVFMGEFGVYQKYAAAAHRKAWTAFIAREAEQRGMSWAYWEFDQGFGAYDQARQAWRPEIYDALIPVDDRR
jgi:endoglucanase